MNESSNKRGATRHPTGNLVVQVRGAGLLSRLRGRSIATWMDFSTSGMAFESPRRLAPGDRVLVDLAVGDVHLESVPAVVRNRRPASSGSRRYGVEFAPDADPADLARVESRLRELTPHLAKDSMAEVTPIEQQDAEA